MLTLYRNRSWRYWLVTAVLLAAALSGWAPGIHLAIALCVVQLAHYLILEGSLRAFPVQLRLAYGILLVIGLWEPLRFVYWIQLVGTWSVVLFGYCFLGRVLTLLPWNRREPLSAPLIKRTFFSPPARGCIL
jgi:hypothetical protein